MNNLVTYLFTLSIPVLFLLTSSSHSNTSTDVGRHLDIHLWGGVLFPNPELQKYISNAPTTGFRIISPYYNNLYVQGDFFYGAFSQTFKNRTIHTVKGGVGLSYRLQLNNKPQKNFTYIPYVFHIGLGLNSIVVKGNTISNTNTHRLLLDDYEMEFGAYPFFHGTLPVFSAISNKLNKLSIIYGAEWNIIFSEPQWSHLFLIQLGVQWSLW